MILNKTTTKLIGKIHNVITDILSLLDKEVEYSQSFLNISGSELSYSSESIYVNLNFKDALTYSESKKDFGFNKIDTLNYVMSKSCLTSELFDNFRDEVFEILESYKLGYRVMNRYESGTCIEFIIGEEPFDIHDNINVSCPGVNITKLKIGSSYYIGTTRPHTYLGVEENLKKRKLLNIEFKHENYSFYFEGLDKPLTTFVRGHVNSPLKIMNRFDYIVISPYKGYFMKDMLAACQYSFSPHNQPSSIESNKVIFDILKKLMNYIENQSNSQL